MTSPTPPEPADHRSGAAQIAAVNAGLYRSAEADVDRLRALLDEAQRAGLIWRHEAERRAERIDRLRRAVAGLRVEVAVTQCRDPEWCGGRCNCTTDAGLLHRAVRAEAKLTAVLALCVDAEASNEEFDGFPDAYVDCRALRHVIEGKP